MLMLDYNGRREVGDGLEGICISDASRDLWIML
jgi:hypothetical protein